MRKQLLGTTALVAAGLFVVADAGPVSAQQKVEPIKVTIGGYVAPFVSFVDQDDVGAAAPGTPAGRAGKLVKIDTHTDQEIHFNGRTTLANGITIGFNVQLEANTSGDQIDESYTFVQGNFGRIEIGQINSVVYRMHFKAPDVFSRGGINEGNLPNFVANPTGSPTNDSTFLATNNRFFDNDGDKINFYTPRAGGFQFGVTYVPDSTQDTAAPTPRSTRYTQGYGVGANFVRALGPVNVQASAGYFTWQGPQLSATTNAPDPDLIQFGLVVGFGGFAIGASYAEVNDGRSNSGVPATAAVTAGAGPLRQEGRAYDIGASYTTGPVSVSITYFNGNNDDSPVAAASLGDDEATGVALAGKYVLGPGISLDVLIFTVSLEGNGPPPTPTSAPRNNDATGGVVGLVLVF